MNYSLCTWSGDVIMEAVWRLSEHWALEAVTEAAWARGGQASGLHGVMHRTQYRHCTLYRIITASSHLVTATLWQVTNENWSHLLTLNVLRSLTIGKSFLIWGYEYLLTVKHELVITLTFDKLNISPQLRESHKALSYSHVMNIFCGYKSILRI